MLVPCSLFCSASLPDIGVVMYHTDISLCFVPEIVTPSDNCIHNLQESFPVPSFLPALSRLALEAALDPRSERLKNACCRACLTDWFTPSKNRAMALSVRLRAYPLRFVNDFTPKFALYATSLKNSYAFQLCISSRPTLLRPKSYPHLHRSTLFLLAHSLSPTSSRPTHDAHLYRSTLFLVAHSQTPDASLSRLIAQRSRFASVVRSPSPSLVTAFPDPVSLKLPNLFAPTANRPTRLPAQRAALAACRSYPVILTETSGGGVVIPASHFDRLRRLAGLAWEGSRGKVRRQRAFSGSLVGSAWGWDKAPRNKTVSCWGSAALLGLYPLSGSYNVGSCWLRTTKPVTRGALFTFLFSLAIFQFVILKGKTMINPPDKPFQDGDDLSMLSPEQLQNITASLIESGRTREECPYLDALLEVLPEAWRALLLRGLDLNAQERALQADCDNLIIRIIAHYMFQLEASHPTYLQLPRPLSAKFEPERYYHLGLLQGRLWYRVEQYASFDEDTLQGVRSPVHYSRQAIFETLTSYVRVPDDRLSLIIPLAFRVGLAAGWLSALAVSQSDDAQAGLVMLAAMVDPLLLSGSAASVRQRASSSRARAAAVPQCAVLGAKELPPSGASSAASAGGTSRNTFRNTVLSALSNRTATKRIAAPRKSSRKQSRKR